MKKRMMFFIGFSLLFVTGCGNPVSQDENSLEKESRIAIYSAADDVLLKTIEDQDTIIRLLDSGSWTLLERAPDDLIPEYRMLVYQEKTLLAGQSPDEEREYEWIETVTTYANSSCITEQFASSVIQGKILPEDVLTFYYTTPDELQKAVSALVHP